MPGLRTSGSPLAKGQEAKFTTAVDYASPQESEGDESRGGSNMGNVSFEKPGFRKSSKESATVNPGGFSSDTAREDSTISPMER